MNSNVVYLREPEVAPRKITTPIAWVRTLFEKTKERQEKSEKKKIEDLLEHTYSFYLDLYLTGVEQRKLVDIHPALYRQGYTICSIAMQLAMEQMLSVIRQKRVNECHKNLQEELRNKERARRVNSGKDKRKRTFFRN